MKFLKTLFLNLQVWFRTKKRYHYKFLEDLPEEVPHYKVLLIGDPENTWLAVFKCPCGCGEIIHLNLLKEASPCWTILITKNVINIKPSIWRKEGCKSHFFIENSKVKWV